MAIYPIQNEAVPVAAHRIVSTGRQGPGGGNTARETSQVQEKDSLVQNHSTWSELQKINDSSNKTAVEDRKIDNLLKGVEEYVDRMRAQLERIVKNFPPFPPGGEERINLLRGYAGFRKLIDQLTIPPPEKSEVAADASRVLSPAESVPGTDKPGERTPETPEA